MALGKAYIEVHADTAPFARELARDLKVILDAAEKELRPSGEKLGRSLATRTAAGIKRDGKKISSEIDNSVKRGFRDSEREAATFGSRLGSVFAGVGGLFSIAGESLVKLASSFTNMSSNTLPAFAGSLYIIVTLVALLASSLVLLASQVYDLIGLLGLVPGALFAIIGVAAPLVVIFKGFGEIFKLVGEDAKTFATDSAKAIPVISQIATILRGFKGIFSLIKENILTSFFTPVISGIHNFIYGFVATFSSGMALVAGTLGRVFRQFMDSLDSPKFRAFVNNLFLVSDLIVNMIGPAMINLFGALADAANAAFPTIENLVVGFAALINKFAAFIEKSIANGSFQEWIDKAVKSAKDLGALVGAVWNLLQQIFQASDNQGKTFLENITDAINKLAAYLGSKEGQQAIHDFVQGAVDFSTHIAQASGNIKSMIDDFKQFKDIFKWLSPIGFFMADGGVVSSPTPAVIGEAGPEVVIPLTKPQRARDLAMKSGLMDMLNTGGGQGDVYVFIGNEPIDARVKRANNRQGRDLEYGPRGL